MFQKAAVKELFPTFTDRSNFPALYLVTVIVAYVALAATVYDQHVIGDRYIYVYVLTALVALSGINVGYATATPAFRILLKCTLSFGLFYIVTSQVQIADKLVENRALAAFELNTAWIIALACGAVGYFRPSFAIVPLHYIFWQKHQLAHVFGLRIEWLDYFTLVETGTFLIVGFLIYNLFRRIEGFGDVFTFGSQDNASVEREAGGTLRTVDVLVLFAIALHFGNYFYAGLIKAVLGGDPTFWVLENRTEFLVLAALDSQVLPLSFSEALTGFTYESLAAVRIFTNFVTITIQLLAAVAILRMRWAIIITLCYDALHLIIFIVTGIFFWKFIILNLAIVAALGVMHIRTVPRPLRLSLSAAVILSPFVFHILPSFAWLDSRSMNRVHFSAITDDGAEYPVPSNYFLGMSVTFAQNRLVWPAEGAIPTETWGVSRSREIMERGLACNWTYGEDEEAPVPFVATRGHIEQYIRRYHTQVLTMLDDRGRFEYDLFPHHIFSMPWYSQAFDQLDKRRIVAYRYESETLCLDYQDGKAQPQRKKLGSFEIRL